MCQVWRSAQLAAARTGQTTEASRGTRSFGGDDGEAGEVMCKEKKGKLVVLTQSSPVVNGLSVLAAPSLRCHLVAILAS